MLRVLTRHGLPKRQCSSNGVGDNPTPSPSEIQPGARSSRSPDQRDRIVPDVTSRANRPGFAMRIGVARKTLAFGTMRQAT
ncbi:hypothetical protein [Methylobacterium brachiatum]|uniref:hypothetical protein n=1 Tax=Methylobacterium brachiatum TaxID=269660 RepID=UPI0008E5FE39|nr:hypothetical protein [Methylobacterium brachiatum]MDH2310546.1 hypothetical protein [Methylobacterium brachiatum]SFI18413.1 hypothetical protein SAMN02799642_01072 [Methylobacterium brachiatum]